MWQRTVERKRRGIAWYLDNSWNETRRATWSTCQYFRAVVSEVRLTEVAVRLVSTESTGEVRSRELTDKMVAN